MTTGGDVAAVLGHLAPYGPARPDWFELLRESRERCPVVHSDQEGGFWLVTRQDYVTKILQNSQAFSSAEGVTIPHHPEAPIMPPIDLDPPLQSDFRRLLNPHLTPAVVRSHEPAIRAMARELIDRFIDKGSCEFMADFARPLPCLVLGRLVLGIEDMDALLDLQIRLQVMGSANTGEEAGNTWIFLRNFVTDLVHAARDRKEDKGIIGALIQGKVENRWLTLEEQIGTLMILVLGGLETTTDAFSWIVHYMTQDGSIEERLRQPDWIINDLDEFLRMITPVQWVGRTVTCPIDVGGVEFNQGEMVMAHLASANRDQARFADGDSLRFDRSAERHLAFGLGAHRCIGSNLARIELQIGFSELLSRVTGIEADGPARTAPQQGMARPIEELPIRFRRLG